MKLNIINELTNGSPAVTLLIIVGIVIVVSTVLKIFHKYREYVFYMFNYNIKDLTNMAWHSCLWCIFWLMYIFNCFGRHTKTESCPFVASLILLGIWLVPFFRTYRFTGSKGHSFLINMVQTFIGFFIGTFLFAFLFLFKGKQDD